MKRLTSLAAQMLLFKHEIPGGFLYGFQIEKDINGEYEFYIDMDTIIAYEDLEGWITNSPDYIV